MSNTKLRNLATKKNVRWWEIADELNISEATMTRKLRKELPSEEAKKIEKLINEIANRKEK